MIRKKRKRYSIDGHYNKQLERAQRRQKTGIVIFITVIGLLVIAGLTWILGGIFQIL